VGDRLSIILTAVGLTWIRLEQIACRVRRDQCELRHAITLSPRIVETRRVQTADIAIRAATADVAPVRGREITDAVVTEGTTADRAVDIIQLQAGAGLVAVVNAAHRVEVAVDRKAEVDPKEAVMRVVVMPRLARVRVDINNATKVKVVVE